MSQDLIIQLPATLALGNLRQTYSGAPEPVTVTTSPAGLGGVSVTYDGSSTPPTIFDDITARARYFGWLIGAMYGEPFLSREEIGVRDLRQLL